MEPRPPGAVSTGVSVPVIPTAETSGAGPHAYAWRFGGCRRPLALTEPPCVSMRTDVNPFCCRNDRDPRLALPHTLVFQLNQPLGIGVILHQREVALREARGK